MGRGGGTPLFRNVAQQRSGSQTVVLGFNNGNVTVDRPQSGSTAGVNSNRSSDVGNFLTAEQRLGETGARQAIGNNMARRLGISDTHEVRVSLNQPANAPTAANRPGGRRGQGANLSAIVTPTRGTPPGTRIPVTTNQLASALSGAARDVANGG